MLDRSLVLFLILHAIFSGDVKPIFGVPLSAAVERSKCHDGVPLPIVVRETIDYIEEFGMFSKASKNAETLC